MKKLLLTFLFFGLVFGLSADDDKKGPPHKGHHKMHFKKMDSNGDGKISKEEWLKFHEDHFKQIDSNSDGFLTEDELKTFHQKKMKEFKHKMKK